MGLSKEEKRQLKALQQKEQEPDAPPIGKSVNFSVDLGDPKQVETAKSLGLLGFLQGDNDDDDENDDDDDDENAETGPRRKGYF